MSPRVFCADGFGRVWTIRRALLQSFVQRAPRTIGSIDLSGRFKFVIRVDVLDFFSQGRRSKAEGAFNDVGLAANVIRDVES
jgi:hypothetical protein